ncbi:EAL domain-containing protein [Pseudonocardia broussonetiae]|uniref:EAL domain-containing protein n=1 Tax=Pseudonocardia broussonetiae TaxID=2736640 RepID=A0A6M6JE76_9PSEU|nr:EAL domain-containing protein [Pseudonocardia broussonetiae]QJY45856.1 EAL domain-containing protein [Pseudonocardia broussonetiae]
MSGVTARPARPPAPATPSRTFDAACQRVVDHLRRHVPLAFWSVSRHVDDQQVHLRVHDEFYGTSSGHAQPWSESFCRHVVDGSAPPIAPDVREVPAFAAAAGFAEIGAYVGVPIRDVDGSVFGMICGLDPRPYPDPGQLHAHRPLLDVLAELLEQILHADHLRVEAAAREAELHWRAHHDHLTGLANRAGFLQRLTDLQRSGRHRPTAVMLIDLDDFKAVNDTFGHTGGDELLVLVADRLRGVVDPADLLARLGGDEFAVIVDHAEPQALAAKVVAALQQTVTLAGRRIRLSATVGVAELGPKGSTGGVDNAVARADTAMYEAKRSGKGRYVVFDPSMALPASIDLAFGEPLQRAITTGTIQAAYQPIVTLPDRVVVGFEALARWPHEGDVVRPGLFIPVAARLGLLPALTDHMLATAVRRLAHWNAQLGHQDMHVGINVSPLCMGDHDFPDRVAACLREHRVDPGQLTLEITEEALLHDLPTATAVAGRLADIGVLLALDDFGTGYSSLLHLRQIPLRAMKIDRGFLHDIDTNVDTAQFVKALLSFGADLGIAVVVEGVEREAQAEVLVDLGCTLAQGHLFGPPAPADSWDLGRP